MSYSQYISYKPSFKDRCRYLDQRYDELSLGFQIPSLRRSVHHTRENTRDPAAPHSYINPNGTLSPLSFRLATESHHISAISVNWGQDGDCVNPIFPLYNNPSDNPFYLGRFFYGNGQPDYPISRFRLFGLSEEAVGKILCHLSSTDLAALALVDKDCCQLVRTRLFRSVWLNFSNTSMALLTALVNEGRERFRTREEGHERSRTREVSHNRWRLGACIRRITVCTDGRANKGSDAIARSWIERRVSNIEAIELHGRHMNALELVLRTAVPNLEFLDWRDRVPLTPLMSSAIGHAPITRLELHYLVLREDFSLDVAELKEKWQLRSLLLRVSVAGQGGLEADNFISSIFELSAPTLEELVWEGSMSGKYNIGTSPMLFPKLSKLQLRWIQADDVVWASLIPANEESRLTHLSIDGCDPDLGSFLARRGHITTLSHLSWTDARLVSNPDCNAFLSANAQLESCRYEEPSNLNPYNNPETDKPREGQQSVVPIFSSSSFHMLTSLSLVWATPTIAAEALRGIATITTLKHLCLSAGIAFGREIDWHVDHKSLRKRLRPLKQLKWLVLTRDAYAHGSEPLWGFEEPQPGMEIRHRDNMMRYARLFAVVLPELEWVHFGRIPMAVKRGTGQELMVVPLQEQADLTTMLGKMWGDRRAKYSAR